MKKIYTRWIAPTLVTIMLSGPAFAAAGLPQAPAAQPDTIAVVGKDSKPATAPAAPKTSDDSARYEAREQQATGLESWSGGAGIYIGGSALALVLLIIILVLIL